MVTAALRALSRRSDLDAIVLIRGGGARNELAVFDAESIARAIAASRVPVLTGLGHEVDRAVADEVAHTALKTPTACAGELIARAANYAGAAETTYAAIVREAAVGLSAADTRLSDTAHRIARRTHAAVERADERLGRRVERLTTAAPSALDASERRIVEIQRRLLDRATTDTARASDRLDVMAARVAALDPAVQLARGWTITRDADGKVVRSVADVAPGGELTTAVADGTISSTVVNTAAGPRPADRDQQRPDPNPT